MAVGFAIGVLATVAASHLWNYFQLERFARRLQQMNRETMR